MMALPSATPAWRLADLLAGFAALDAPADFGVADLALDSRQVVPGTLFLACRGSVGHGMSFAEHARGRGAVAIAAEPTAQWDSAELAAASARLRLPIIPVPGLADRASALADRFYGAPSAHMDVIGITGTSGKTSVSHFLAQTMGNRTRCAALGAISTISAPTSLNARPSHEAGVAWSEDLAPGPDGAPDAVAVQDTLARLRASGAQTVAMAVSPAALARGSVSAVRFTHAVFTNRCADHLDLDAETAGILFSSPGLHWAVLNAADTQSAQILAGLDPRVRVALYGLGTQPPAGWRCDLWVGLTDLTPLRRGLRLRVVTAAPDGAGEGAVEVGVLGAFNAANLQSVVAVLLSHGLTLPVALQAVARVRGVAGRMEPFGGEAAPLVAVDCARTPDALDRAITNLRRHGGGRLITVFGCAGERSRSFRALMGGAAEAGSDLVILTDDNPRGEDGDAIASDILLGTQHPERVRVERRRGLAIRIALTLAGRQDTILVAGKGHETTQDLGELKVRFSDRAQVVQALREWTEGRC